MNRDINFVYSFLRMKSRSIIHCWMKEVRRIFYYDANLTLLPHTCKSFESDLWNKMINCGFLTIYDSVKAIVDTLARKINRENRYPPRLQYNFSLPVAFLRAAISLTEEKNLVVCNTRAIPTFK